MLLPAYFSADLVFECVQCVWFDQWSYRMPDWVSAAMGDCLGAGGPSWYVISHLDQLSLPSLWGR